MMNDNTSDSVTDAQGAAASVGDGNASQDVESLSEILAEATGRKFKSNEDALKAVKDTFSYVGKVGKYLPTLEKLESKIGNERDVISFLENSTQGQQPQASHQQDNNFVSREQYESDTFFSKNPLYAEHRKIIESMKKATGKSLQEVTELPELKTVLEKVKGFDETQKSKSILHTNPRLGSAVDKMTSAKDAVAKGNQSEAAALATKAVMEAFEQ